MGAIRGSQKIADGHYWRGIEQMVPKFARDPLKAIRYQQEGALNTRGDALKPAEAFSTADLLLQAGGLADHELSKQYARNNAIKGYERHVLKRRKALLQATGWRTSKATPR